MYFLIDDFLSYRGSQEYEIKYFQKYDYFIVNDDLETASKELVSIANVARIKSKLFDSKLPESWID